MVADSQDLHHQHKTAQFSVAGSSEAGLLHRSTPSQYTGGHQLNKHNRIGYCAIQIIITNTRDQNVV